MRSNVSSTLPRLLAGALALTGGALAHAELIASVPAENSRVAAPHVVKLTFGEGVELGFSTFKVYPLKATGDALTLNRAADALMARVIGLKTDAAARADTGMSPTRGAATRITLKLKPGLAKGTYVVMWKVLSVDTHASGGRYLFTVK